MNNTITGNGPSSSPVRSRGVHREGTNLILKAGEHHDIPISSLISRMFATGRWSGTAKFSYWLEPGDYSLTATFTTGSGPKRVRVVTEPVQLRVVKAP